MAEKTNIQKLIGKKYNYLTLIEEKEPHITKGGNKHRTALFKCKCGNEKIIQVSSVFNFQIKSCGCYTRKMAKKRMILKNTKHGFSKIPEYNVWLSMKKRCNNPNNNHYKYYGGRGIKICIEWNNDFLSFFNDMGKRPSRKHSIDRIDNNKGYFKENCRWAKRKQQARNVRNNLILEAFGEKKCMAEWAEILGFSWQKLYYRLIISKNYNLENLLKEIKYDNN
jgi:hypothetical protein